MRRPKRWACKFKFSKPDGAVHLHMGVEPRAGSKFDRFPRSLCCGRIEQPLHGFTSTTLTYLALHTHGLLPKSNR